MLRNCVSYMRAECIYISSAYRYFAEAFSALDYLFFRSSRKLYIYSIKVTQLDNVYFSLHNAHCCFFCEFQKKLERTIHATKNNYLGLFPVDFLALRATFLDTLFVSIQNRCKRHFGLSLWSLFSCYFVRSKFNGIWIERSTWRMLARSLKRKL